MTASGAAIRVLHVDDEPGFAEMVAQHLQRADDQLTVATATSATAGLDHLEDASVDCIVSDYDMPGRNGIEFFEAVREAGVDVPFILYTGKGSEAIASDAISAGVTDYLQKETGTSQYTVLANRIANTVEQHRGRREMERRRERRERHGEALLELTTDDAVVAGEFETALERITETAADVLDVPRVNVWLFDDDRSVLRCVDHFDRSGGTHESGMELVAEQYPSYFEALASSRSLAATDAHEDRRTSQLEPYLEDHDVAALLDATVRSEGEVVGVICHEHVGDPREWTDDEIEFASDVAELVHRAYRNRERAERAAELERSQARFHALTRNTPHTVMTIDAESTIRYVNDSIETVLGYSPEELVGESLLTIMPERFHDDHRAAIDRYLEEGTRRLNWDWIELPAVHSDGHEVPLGISFGEATIDGEHRFTALVRDIADRKERERELERARDLLAQTERIADVGGWEIDTETTEVFWTDHLFDLMDVDGDEEPPLEEALDFYHEDDRPVLEHAVDQALTEGEPFDEEVRYYSGDDEVRWLRARGYPAVEDGEVVTLRGAVQDVTERRARERMLREMYGIISDTDSSFDEQVRSLLELGRAELDVAYGTLSEIRGDDYVFDVVAAADDRIREGDVVPLDATNCEIAASTQETLVLGDIERDAPEETDRAGFTEWGIACYIGTPVYLDGAVHGTFCFYDTEPRADQFSDWEITFVDLMARWVSTELERLRTNEQLREQNEQLEAFASIVSHDLRNPLNVASGRLELEREDGDSEHLQAVAAAHDRMEALIEDLLQLAREGERAKDAEPVELGALAEACWGNVDVADATLTLAEPPSVRADRGRLKQLLENLVRNAIEHGGPSVTVTIGPLDDGFYVEDDGPGIPQDDHEDVLEAGYSTNEDGTGFGLNIVAQIADAHGWELQLATGKTGGARFEFTGVELVD